MSPISYAEGIKAISRWSSEANTTGIKHQQELILKGSQQDSPAAIPSGSVGIYLFSGGIVTLNRRLMAEIPTGQRRDGFQAGKT